jgi:hypothetical protein
VEEGHTPASRKDTGFEFKKLLALEPSALDPLDNPETLEVSSQGLVALSLCTGAPPLYTRFANIFGASVSEMTMRPNPRSSRGCCAGRRGAAGGALDRASPNFMALASFGLDIGIFCDCLYSVLLLNAILALYFLGLALSSPRYDYHFYTGELRCGGAGCGILPPDADGTGYTYWHRVCHTFERLRSRPALVQHEGAIVHRDLTCVSWRRTTRSRIAGRSLAAVASKCS